MFRSPWLTTVWYVFLVLNLNASRSSMSSTSKDDTAGIIDGDIVLGGLFRIRKPHTVRTNDSNKCSDRVEVEVGIQRVEAMLYAIQEVNNDPELLPNVRLGAEIRDTCSLKTKALDESLKFVLDTIALRSSSSPQQSEKCVRNTSKDVVGVVGASRSTLSIEVAKLLRLFKVPQVSYASTSAELSNKNKYSYFARTVPPDSLQALAMLHVVEEFKWKSVFTINSAGSYGEKGIEEFKKRAKNNSLCIVRSEQVTDKSTSEDYNEIFRRFSEFSSTRVIILFLKDNHVKKLLLAAKENNYTNSVFIASDEWGTREDIVELSDMGDFFEHSDAVTITLPSLKLPKFEKYFRNLNGSKPRVENPWFQKYWQECGNSTCNESAFNDKLPYVIDGVYAFAHALHDIYKEKCPNMSGLCDEMKPVNSTELRDRILNVSFKGKSSQVVSFDKKGDSKGKYTLFHYNKSHQYHKIGEWQNQLNLTNVPARLINFTSSCDDECNPWSRRLAKKGTTCCVRCLDCPNKERQYVNGEIEQKCENCPSDERPNANYTGCQKLPLRHISKPWFITITFFASLGAMCTLMVTALMLYNINTPLVRSSERDLIFLLLLGVLLSYTIALVLVTRANVIICAAQRFGYGVSVTICYASLLVKTDRIGRIFMTRNSKSVHFTKPHTHLVVVFLLVSVEVSLAAAGLAIEHPRVIKVLPTTEGIFAKCNFGALDSMISLPYNVILIALCTFYSFRIRKVTSMFNEARNLGFVMYSTCVVWIAFVPVQLGTAESYQPIAMSLHATLNATTILVCLFGPKVYVIVFRPLRNAERSASVTVNHFSLEEIQSQGQSRHVRNKPKDSQDTSVDSGNKPKDSQDTSVDSGKHQKCEKVDSENQIPRNNVNDNKSTQPEVVKPAELSENQNSKYMKDENEQI